MNEAMAEIYDIIKTQHDEPQTDWKLRLGDWLHKSNKNLPIISNECAAKPHIGYEEKASQTKTTFKEDKRTDIMSELSVKSFGSTPIGSSALFTSSSCISCHGFESSARSSDACKDLVAAKKAVCEIDAEIRSQARMKAAEEEEEEHASEEHICEGEADVEYIIVQEEQFELARVGEERVGVEEEQEFDEHVAEEAEIKSIETPSIASERDLKT